MGRYFLLAALGSICLTAGAEDVLEPVETHDEHALAALIEQPIPPKFCLDPEPASLPDILAALDASADELRTPDGFDHLEQTDGTLDRIIRARRVRLLSLMKSESAAVFFGVNANGRFGVHLDASRLIAP